jgi:ubiquinone/menaquinone biosynthesis C-methylase UbiE
MMNRYYDTEHNRLVCIGDTTHKAYWDNHWRTYDFMKQIKIKRNRFVLSVTKKYLPRGSRILEGGCGMGDKVYILHYNGYNAYGVDYARETVKKINYNAPELKITCQDVRQLNFENNFFDGYWSLGVIEHFYEGYDQILFEMKRVLKKNGYLFLAIPSMSFIRKLKVKLSIYPEYKESEEMIKSFYQFISEDNEVISKFRNNGFELREKKRYDGIKGLKDEFYLLKPILQKIYDSSSFHIKVMGIFIDKSIRTITGHMSFFVFQKL